MHLGWFFCADILYRRTTMRRRNMWIRMSASIYFPSSPLYSGYPQFLALLGKSCFWVITVLSNSYLVYHGVSQFQSWSSSSEGDCSFKDVWSDKHREGALSDVRSDRHREGEDEVGVALTLRGVLPRPRGEQPHKVNCHHHHHHHHHQQQPTPSIWDKFKYESLMQLLVGVIYSLLVATVYLFLRALACSWVLFCLTFISGCRNHWDYLRWPWIWDNNKCKTRLLE